MRGLLPAVAVALSLAAASFAAEEVGSHWSTGFGYRGTACSAAAIPEVPEAYYGIDLVPTKRVPGTGAGSGLGEVSFADSPFGVSVSDEGEYVYDIAIRLERLKPPKTGKLTAWVAKSDLSEVASLGPLDGELRVRGRVAWNKFLVVVTLEPEGELGNGWRGPIVMRGMSRSGMMHTLAGHGPFEKEPCAKYGFK